MTKDAKYDFVDDSTKNKKNECRSIAISSFANPEEKGVSTLEYIIKIGKSKVASFFIQDKMSVINRFKMRIKLLEDCFDLPKYQLLILVLDIGLHTLENIVKNNPDDFDFGDNKEQKLATINEHRRLDEIENLIAMWERIYKDRGLDGFSQWCVDTNQPEYLVEKFMQTYTWVSPEMKPSIRDKKWLRDFLETQPGEIASIQKIKEAAMNDGIINDDKDFARLEKNAERCEHVYKSYGEWGLAITSAMYND